VLGVAMRSLDIYLRRHADAKVSAEARREKTPDGIDLLALNVYNTLSTQFQLHGWQHVADYIKEPLVTVFF
jgi:hypothetical protein